MRRFQLRVFVPQELYLVALAADSSKRAAIVNYSDVNPVTSQISYPSQHWIAGKAEVGKAVIGPNWNS